MKAVFPIALLSLLALGAIFFVHHSQGDLSNSSNVTTFFQQSSCIQKLKYYDCDHVEELSKRELCYFAASQVSRFTYADGDLLKPECKSYLSYLASSVASDPINGNNYYYECYLSGDVLKQAYSSYEYYNNIYVPRQITCAGY